MLVGELYFEALSAIAVGSAIEKGVSKLKPLFAKVKWKLPKTIQKRAWPIEYGKKQIEKQLAWGEAKFLQPGGFEVWASTVEAHRYVGYPIIYGRKGMYVVIQVTKPTAFQQIMKGIERGMFPKMGGLAAKQRVIFRRGITGTSFAKAGESFRQFARSVAKPTKAMPLVTLPKITEKPSAISYERAKERFMQVAVQKPKQVERLVAVPKLGLRRVPYELEKEKYRPLEVAVQKPKQKVAVIQKLQLLQKLAPPRLVAPPTLYRPPYQPPTFPPYRERRLKAFVLAKRRKELFGRWFKKKHPIATPKQVLSLTLGGRKTRRATKSFSRRVKSLVSG